MDSLLNDPFKMGGNNSNHQINEKPVNSLDLPPPPSKDQILGDVEKIKQQYYEQKDDWNKHLDLSKKEADEKLNEMLNKYKQS